MAVLDAHAASRERLVSIAVQGGVEVKVKDVPRPDMLPLIRDTRCDAVLFGSDRRDGLLCGLSAIDGLPVVLCGADTAADMVAIAQEIGAMSFLVTPVRPEQVVPTLTLAITRFRETERLRTQRNRSRSNTRSPRRAVGRSP